MQRAATVEEYILNSGEWEEALILLRELLKESEMEESLKWGMPYYTLNGKHVVGIAGFKQYAGLWFTHGALLKDPHKVLVKADEGVGGQRQWRFGSADEIRDQMEIIAEYINEAIENQRQGRMVKPVKNKPYTIPEELQNEIDSDPHLKVAFEALSHSKKREFSLYIGKAKRPETRQKRLRESLPMIREGRGLMDKYR